MNKKSPPSDFKIFLELELARRIDLNGAYSMRAFARDLSIDSSFLSKLLSGKRAMTVRTIMNLGSRLDLSDKQIHFFIQKASGRRRYMGDLSNPDLNKKGFLLIPEYAKTMSLMMSEKRYHDVADKVSQFYNELSNSAPELDDLAKEYQLLISLFPVAK